MIRERVGLLIAVAFLISGCALVDPPEVRFSRESLKGIAITEINYNPPNEGTIDGDTFEFIEIKNISSSIILLNNVAFTKGIDYAFPVGASINPGEFIILSHNSKEFAVRYGFAPFGVYTGKLSNSGEKITMSDLDAGKDFLTVEYNDQWPPLADGDGRTLVPIAIDSASLLANPSFWRSSFKPNGSPGKDDPMGVYISEVLTHTDPPLQDAVELYNPNSVPVDISGWYLTDNKNKPAKFKIPAGTTVAAKGYKVFYSTEFNNSTSVTAFNFSEHGDDIYLYSDSTGVMNGYAHGFSFGETENPIPFGRYLSSTGEEHFVAQKSISLGEKNAGPRVGPITISEVMYKPTNIVGEYIELHNFSSEDVLLYDKKNPQNTWKIDEIAMALPTGVTMGAGEKILIISKAITVSDFRKLYGVSENVQIFSKTVDLADSGATLTLLKPEEPYIDSATSLSTIINPYMIYDKVSYKNAAPWPKEADGQGMSLVKTQSSAYGNDPANWKAAKPSPGK